MKKILFISGSLRKESYNTQLMAMAADILSKDFSCSFLDYRDIPFINQDIEFPAPASVERAREATAEADAIWIGSPEYNHSYSASLKNLIDWLSRPVEAGDYSTAVGRGKLIALSSAAGTSGGAFSLAKLREVLAMLSSRIIEKETMIALGSRFGEERLVLTEEEKTALAEECMELKTLLNA